MSLAVLGRRGDVVLTTVFFTAALVTVLTAAALGLRVLVLRALGVADTVIKMNQRVMSESKWQMSGVRSPCSIHGHLRSFSSGMPFVFHSYIIAKNPHYGGYGGHFVKWFQKIQPLRLGRKKRD